MILSFIIERRVFAIPTGFNIKERGCQSWPAGSGMLPVAGSSAYLNHSRPFSPFLFRMPPYPGYATQQRVCKYLQRVRTEIVPKLNQIAFLFSPDSLGFFILFFLSGFDKTQGQIIKSPR